MKVKFNKDELKYGDFLKFKNITLEELENLCNNRGGLISPMIKTYKIGYVEFSSYHKSYNKSYNNIYSVCGYSWPVEAFENIITKKENPEYFL